MMDILRKTLSGISAGILISIGGCVYLACDNKYVGALLFCVALVCICYKGYSLFTGKVGYLAEKCGKEEISVLFLGLLGNVIGTSLCSAAISYAFPAYSEKAAEMCAAKLTQTFGGTAIRAIFCGVLMYLAVSIFRDRDKVIGILLCIPVFILSGFEHSIADMFYFAVSGTVSLRAFGFIWTVIAGNAVGALILPFINKSGKKETKK